MSELSNLYVPQYQYDYNQAMGRYESEVVYPWRNNSTYEDYFQSFNKYPDRGYIDQSIFGFRRMDDDWSLGAYCSSIFTKNESGVTMPDAATFFFHTSKNTLSKNQAALTTVGEIFDALDGPQGYHSYPNSYDLINYHQYSPDTTKMAYYDATFISNFKYNQYCMLPIFYILYTDNGQISYGVNYNAIDTTRPLIVIGLTINYAYAGSIPQAYPCFIQFAGNVQSCGTSGWYAPQMGEIVPAVFEVIGCNKIFGGLIHNGTELTNSSLLTQTVFFNLEHLLTETAVTGGRRYWGLSLENAVTIVNRLGFYWTKAAYYDGAELGTHCTNPDISVPIIDENTHCVTTQVLEGTDIADYAYDHPNSILNCDVGADDYNGKSFTEFREGYDSHQTTVDETEEIDLNEPVSATSGGNTVWIMSEEKIKEFFMWLWNPDGTIYDDIVKALALLGENPMDSVVTLKLYPFDISRTRATYSYANICFGRKESPINAPHLTSSNVVIFDLGSFIFNDAGMTNDFRDYEPFSDYSLYIPFTGIIQLQAIECINTTITIKMIVDLITGSSTTVVYTNGVPYKYIDGQIGIDMPVTGRNMADYGKTILAGALAGAMAGKHLAGKAAGAITSGHISAANTWASVASTANPGAEMENAENISSRETIKAVRTPSIALGLVGTVAGAAIGGGLTALMNAPQPETAGSNSPATGLAKPLFPYFIVRRSDCWIPENYNHLYGRPLNEGGVVGDFTGFSKFASIKVENIDGATPEEIKLIVELLQSGVYL